jgi:hypothetical protein
MTTLAKTLTANDTFNHFYRGLNNFFWQGRKLTLNQRTVRLTISLIEPVLSITDLLDKPWEIGFELVSIFMIVTSLTGVCFAGKLWRMVRSVGKEKGNSNPSLNESA